jgi:hypothetical protein
MATASSIFDLYFEPITTMFTREMAEAIINRKPDPRLVARVVALAQKAEDGTLTDDEREEYKHMIDLGDIVSLLKLKARDFLKQNPS